MRFRNNAFWWGGAYGVLLALAFFLGEKLIMAKMPPELNHPEYYYTFAGALLVWHLLYLYISNHMQECRGIMPFATLEKISFAVPVFALYLTKRITSLGLVGGAVVDLVWGALFFANYVKLSPARTRLSSAAST
jgi:hypothetical protein